MSTTHDSLLLPARPRLPEVLAEVSETGAETYRQILRKAGESGMLLIEGSWIVEVWKISREVCKYWLTTVDPWVAWQLFASRDWIPSDQLTTETRLFDCYLCDGTGGAGQRETDNGWSPHTCMACNGVGERGYPITVEAAVLLASDWLNVLTAEAIAREMTRCERVIWRQLPYHDRRTTSRVVAAEQMVKLAAFRDSAWDGRNEDLLDLGYPIVDFGIEDVVLGIPVARGGPR